MGRSESPLHKIETSFIVTLIGILFLFSFAVVITLVAPRFIDGSWVEPTSDYQVQMYEISDPNTFISNSATGTYELQFVQRAINGYTLFAYVEGEKWRLVSAPELAGFINAHGSAPLKLTSKLLLLRPPEGDLKERAKELADVEVFELYDPKKEEAFVYSGVEGSLENWVDKDFTLMEKPQQPYHEHKGVLYVKNPTEYRVRRIHTPRGDGFTYDPKGEPIASLEELTGPQLGFTSRKDLIHEGEHIYAIEGCWYCHTDQTRTLVQDLVLNGWEDYPAPPSSANEYIYQEITFPGTKRNGPDLSRTGVKRPSRDWHKSHFWSPVTESPGSIMPSFHHFFDNDPRGTTAKKIGVPNRRFEAMYQYLMTKGTRITSPTECWWQGKDPVHTKRIIEGLEP